jgi:hypothetical protein
MLLTSTRGSGASCGEINGTVIAEACDTALCTDAAAAIGVVACAVLAAVTAGVAVAVVRKRPLKRGATSAPTTAGWTVTEEYGLPLLDRGPRPSATGDGDDDAAQAAAAAAAAAAGAAAAAAATAAAAAASAHERQIVGAMSKLLADDASRSRWTTVQELALLLPQFHTHRVSLGSSAAGAAGDGTLSEAAAAAAAAGDDQGRDSVGVDSASADAAAAAAAFGTASAASLAVAEAASAVLRTALAEQKLLLLQAVDRTDLAQMNFYGERVQMLQSVAGEDADGGGGGGSRVHADAFPMECVAPGLLLRKVRSANESVIIRRQHSGGGGLFVVVVFRRW